MGTKPKVKRLVYASPQATEHILSPESRMEITLDKAEMLLHSGKQSRSFLSKIPPRGLSFLAHKVQPIYTKVTPFQTLVLARYAGRIALFQDGEWQFLSGEDAEGNFHKHEAKLPAMLADTEEPEVLIIGGGDGLAARDILEAKPKARITLVDIDREMIKFAATHPIMRKLNKDSIQKVKPVAADGISFMLNPKLHNKYDLIVVDLPDPIRETTSFLYDYPLVIGILNALKPTGVVSIYATTHGSPLQSWLAHELKKFFYKVWTVPAHVEEMGTAGFVWAKYKKPEAELAVKRYLREALKDHLENMRAVTSPVPEFTIKALHKTRVYKGVVSHG